MPSTDRPQDPLTPNANDSGGTTALSFAPSSERLALLERLENERCRPVPPYGHGRDDDVVEFRRRQLARALKLIASTFTAPPRRRAS